MKRLMSTLLFAVMLISASGCGKQPEKTNGFFALMDGYLAMSSEEEFTFAFTYFYKGRTAPFEPDEFITLSFDGLEDKIEISNYSVEPRDNDKSYNSYAFTLTVRPLETGVFRTDKLVANIDNTYVTFKIGTWVFDVVDSDKVSNALLNTGESPAASNNSRALTYDYKKNNDTAKIKEIWFSEDGFVSDSDHLPLYNKIELPETMAAPINFIRPKIIVEFYGEEIVCFGISCYCGALNVEDDDLERSREYSRAS